MAVFEDDDADVVLGALGHVGLETAVVAGVVDFDGLAGGGVDEPAEAVPGVGAALIVAEFAVCDANARGVGLVQETVAQDFTRGKSAFPGEDVAGGGVEASVGACGVEGLFALVVFVPATVTVGGIAVGGGGGH